MKSSPSEQALDRALALRAARSFFLDDQSKVEIAKDLGISRFKVARLLDFARKEGIVTITIDEGFIDSERSARLVDALGLNRAVVVGASGNEDEVRHTIGRAAAALLAETLHDGEIVGMGWGRTLGATAEAIEQLPRVTVVQMTGATEMTRHLSPVEIVRRLGSRADCNMMPIFAPLVADDVATADVFRRQSEIARTLELHGQVTTAVMSIGSWNPPSSQLFDTLSAPVQQELLARGVVAEMGVTLVDAEGQEVAPDFAERCIAVTAQQLRDIPRVIGVATSAAKAAAVIALTRAGFITELVVDAELSDAIEIALEGSK